jgi:beta-galactosidase
MNMIPKTRLLSLVLLVGSSLAVGCSGSSTPASNNGGSAQAGGSGAGGGPADTGGSASGGQITTNGGSVAGSQAGGASGGAPASGGVVGPGGRAGSGGAPGLGGVTAAGGGPVAGAPALGGAIAAGGSTVVVSPGRVRGIIPFDASWLYHNGDATGADTAAFADSSWRSLSVPHDWAIEGTNPPANPFSATAATTGRGGWVASGIAWYRKHFTLPQNLSGDQVYVEFDGVMGNSTVYVNGTQIGNHPYGYVTFRYDITANVKFGTTDNVISVKCDTSKQPASRFYAGAGIYRHVRLLATNPVHIDQWATYVQTPAATITTASAVVHVQTSVVNSGTTSQSVTVQGIVSGPDGTQAGTGAAAAATIAGGASASFTFDVTVANPKLWDLTNPNMYSLLANVQVGGATVDDDVVSFGIRTLTFDAKTGMTLNGKSVYFQGAANHQDYHGLGLAAPARAIQRRIAQLKTIGVNAWRTAHDPPAPDLLDLTDRMGMLVLDEFTDVWTAHKYQDAGDYALYFDQAATTPTGMPAVPGVATGAKWWQVDFTGFIMRDRNHPSVALYSLGNEIHDSHASRVPTATQMVSISHTLDPAHKVTQALLDPATAGDINNGTTPSTISYPVDVWGNNYDVTSAVNATTATTPLASLLTEEGEETSTWATITKTPGFTGEFMWTGTDYMGEVDGQTTKIGGGGGLMDSLGFIRANGHAWQKIWGVPTTTNSTGAVAGKVTVTADHSTLVTDNNDVVFFQAAITGADGTPITFAITGPGTIIAVDSGGMGMETFRGNTRSTANGVAYAIVQATGAGTITVTASATGLTAGSASVTASVGTWVPCSGTCD